MADFDPITELQRCMALVRPVGMTDSAVKDWLTAAAAEIAEFAHYRPEQFRLAAAAVRKEATHHGQIVPGILKRQFYDWELANGDAKRGLAYICGKVERLKLEQRGGAKQIGQVKALADHRG